MDILSLLKEDPAVLRAEQAEAPEEYAQAARLYTFRYRSATEEIEGMLGVPADLNEPRPAVVYCHGGNRDLSPMQPASACRLAAAGYIGIGSQYRGCSGSTGHDEFGGADVLDVIRVTDLALRLPFVRKEGVYMQGHSRGGMMAYLCAACDRRIRAVAVGAGMADCFIMYDRREQSMKEVFHELVGGSPEQLPEEFRRRSAVCWAGRIEAPVLICQGTADWRVDPQQSIDMDAALEAAGREHKLIIYENANHSLRGTSYYDDVLAWFGAHPL